MSKVSNFTYPGRQFVETTLNERHGGRIAVKRTDSEIRLDQTAREITVCPVFHWQTRGIDFVVFNNEWPENGDGSMPGGSGKIPFAAVANFCVISVAAY